MNGANLRSLVAATAAGVGYGAWAWFANSAAGDEAALKAALVQGGYSFVLTFLMTHVTQWLYCYTGGLVWLTTLLSSVLLLITAYAIHVIAGTPEVGLTIAPGFTIGTVYTAFFVVYLKSLTQSVESAQAISQSAPTE